MRVFTAHQPPVAAARAEGPLLLRDSFAWGACLFGGFWLLLHRLWFEALAWLGLQAAADTRSDTHIKEVVNPVSAINFNMGTLVGSYASIARMLDEMATVPGTSGALLTFDDFVQGIEDFGTRIQPLMTTRREALAAA